MIDVAYTRVSTDDQDTDMQKSVILEQAKKDNVTIVEFYEDDGISGAFIDKRPDIMRLIANAEKKLFDKVYFYKLDRAFRNLEEQIFVLNKLKKLGIKYTAVRDPDMGDGASGRMFENFMGLVNQFERELTAERVFDKHRSMAMEGKWTGGKAPLGYTYDKETKELSIEKSESWLIEKVYATYLQIESQQQTMEILHNDINPRTGLPLSITDVRNILRNPHYSGQISWARRKKRPGAKWSTRTQEYEVFEGNHDGIIPKETFNRVQELINFNRNRTRKTHNVTYLLTGIMECAYCGANIVGLPRGSRKYDPMYKCPTKGRKGVDFCRSWRRTLRFIDDVVINALKANIRYANMIEVQQPKVSNGSDYKDKLFKKLQAINNRMKKQVEVFEAGIGTLEELKEKRTIALKEKEQIETELKKQPTTVVSEEFIKVFRNFDVLWDEADIEGQRKIIRTLIDKVITNGLDVEIVFKDFALPGWQKTIKAEAEESSHFKRSGV